MSNNRRDVLRWIAVGAGSLLGLLPELTQHHQTFAQDKSSPKASPAPSPKLEYQSIAKTADLKKEGWLLVSEGFKAGPLILIQESPDKVVALSAKCTHTGCVDDWKLDGKELVCTCHGSRFSFDGKVIKGPAKRPLPSYLAKVEGESVFVGS
jgi:cytochrome b6-f complex iron-sulfur subunit